MKGELNIDLYSFIWYGIDMIPKNAEVKSHRRPSGLAEFGQAVRGRAGKFLGLIALGAGYFGAVNSTEKVFFQPEPPIDNLGAAQTFVQGMNLAVEKLPHFGVLAAVVIAGLGYPIARMLQRSSRADLPPVEQIGREPIIINASDFMPAMPPTQPPALTPAAA